MTERREAIMGSAWAKPSAPASGGTGTPSFPKRPFATMSRAMGTNGASMTVERSKADLCAWRMEAIRRIEADYNRSADTHLIRVDLPRYPGITLYLKDESSQTTGSLKNRMER